MSLRPDNVRDRVTAGRRDRQIIIERHSVTRNEWNEPVEGWAELTREWASKEDVSDSEKLRAAQIGGTVTTRFRVLSNPKTRTITSADRLTCEGVQYGIVGTKEIGRREGIEITASRANDTLVPE